MYWLEGSVLVASLGAGVSSLAIDSNPGAFRPELSRVLVTSFGVITKTEPFGGGYGVGSVPRALARSLPDLSGHRLVDAASSSIGVVFFVRRRLFGEPAARGGGGGSGAGAEDGEGGKDDCDVERGDVGGDGGGLYGGDGGSGFIHINRISSTAIASLSFFPGRKVLNASVAPPPTILHALSNPFLNKCARNDLALDPGHR